jgi:hypothetical protein
MLLCEWRELRLHANNLQVLLSTRKAHRVARGSIQHTFLHRRCKPNLRRMVAIDLLRKYRVLSGLSDVVYGRIIAKLKVERPSKTSCCRLCLPGLGIVPVQQAQIPNHLNFPLLNRLPTLNVIDDPHLISQWSNS